MKELVRKDWTYTLSENDNGDYIFNVLCGTHAMYMLTIKLNETELAEYAKEGTDFLDKFSRKICGSPWAFSGRAIHE